VREGPLSTVGPQSVAVDVRTNRTLDPERAPRRSVL